MLKKVILLFGAALLLLTYVSALADDAAQQVFDALWSEDQQAILDLWEQMDPAAQQQITPVTLESLKGQLTQAYGPWQGNGQTLTATSGEMVIYQMPVQLERITLQMQLVLKDDTIMGLAFTPLAPMVTPEPAEPADEFVEMEILIGEGTQYPLPGTLTLPKEGSHLPLAVLVHGSGPNDRHETVGATQMFRDLAHELAKQGIASIRYDKRTYVHGASFTAEQLRRMTVYEETIQDAVRAAQLARTLDEIDPDRIWVIGHSLGAMLAPRIVEEAQGIFKGMVLLSGSPKTLLEIMISQNQALVDTLTGELKDQQQALLDAYISDARRILALDEAAVYNEAIFGQPAYYFWEMQHHDTAELIQRLQAPTLIINGGRDFQVADADGIQAWQESLHDASHVELVYEKTLNHVLMTYTGDPQYQGSLREYDTPAKLDAGVSQRIAAWLLKHK